MDDEYLSDTTDDEPDGRWYSRSKAKAATKRHTFEHLEKKYKRKKQKFRELQAKANSAQQRIQQLYQENAAKRLELKRLHGDEISRLNMEFNQKSKPYADMERRHGAKQLQLKRFFDDEIFRLNADFEKRIKPYAGLETRYESKVLQLTDENRRLKEDQEVRIRNAQDAAKTIMKDYNPNMMSDDDIEKYFKSEASFWYNWAKSHAHQDINAVFDLEEAPKVAFLKALGLCMLLEDGDIPTQFRQGRKAKTAPALLLQAMLANFMFNEVITNGFLILDDMINLLEKRPNKKGIKKDVSVHNSATDKVFNSLKNCKSLVELCGDIADDV